MKPELDFPDDPLRCTEMRPCVECGNPTDRGRWCSTACHRADEPEAYEVDE